MRHRTAPLSSLLPLVLAALVLALALPLGAPTAAAAPLIGGELDPTFSPPFLSGSRVLAIAVEPGGRILLGGSFSTSATSRSGLLRLNPDGTLDPGFWAGIAGNTSVRALALQPDGKILVAGGFGSPLVRLMPDGAVDASFATPLTSQTGVRDVELLPDGKILVAAERQGGASEGYLVEYYVDRLAPDGARDPSFTRASPFGPVWQLASLPDGKIMLGGTFTAVNGQPRSYLARLLPDGALDPDFASPGLSGSVAALAVQPDGGVLVGGFFTSWGGQLRNRLARLLPDGTLDQAIAPRMENISAVASIAVGPDGSAIVAGTPFTYGQPHQGVNRFHASGTLDRGFHMAGGADRPIGAVAVTPGGDVLVGGDFATYDGRPRPALARLYGSARPGAVGFTVAALGVEESAGAATITLRRSGGSDRAVGAELRVVGGSATAADYTPPRLEPDNPPPLGVRQTLVQPDGKILIAGDFLTVAGQPRGRIARLHADGSLDLSFDPGLGADQQVEALALQRDGRVLIGGMFQRIDGRPQSHLARLNPDGSLDAGFRPQLDDRVWEIAQLQDDRLVVGGIFGTVGEQARPLVARLNPDGSLDQGFNAGLITSGHVAALLAHPDGSLLIGGIVQRDGMTGPRTVLRLGPDGAADPSFANPFAPPSGTMATSRVREIAFAPDGKLLIVGAFTFAGQTRTEYVGRLNADGSRDPSFAPLPGPDAMVTEVEPLPDGGLLIAGEFVSVDGALRRHLARLSADGSLDPGFAGQGGADRPVLDIARLPGGALLAAGEFTRLGGSARAGLALLNGAGEAGPDFDAGVGRSALVTWEGGDDDEKRVIIPIVADGVAEGPETVTFALSVRGGAAPAEPTTLTVTIVDPQAPRFVSPPPAAAAYGAPYAHQFTVEGLSAPRFTVSVGALPPGLALDPASGALGGAPLRAGRYGPLTVSAEGGLASAQQSLTIDVAPATLTVAALDRQRHQGEANPPLEAAYSGFVAGDGPAALTGASVCATEATAASPAGRYPIVCEPGTLAADNYRFSFVPGVLRVLPRPGGSGARIYLPAVTLP